MAMLIPSVGNGGSTSQLLFAQRTLCGASALLWAALTATKWTHAPRDTQRHNAKMFLTSIGSITSLVPIILGTFSDIETLSMIVFLVFVIVVAELRINALPTDGRAVS